MTLEPIFTAPWHIQAHIYAAFLALTIGVVQLVLPKGRLAHRILGTVWIVAMWIVVIAAVFIIRPRGPDEPFTAHFSFIHYILIPLTTVVLLLGMRALTKSGPEHRQHAKEFVGIFIGSLLIAGGFTFMPGRLMYDVITGNDVSANAYAYDLPYLYFLPGAEPPERDRSGKYGPNRAPSND